MPEYTLEPSPNAPLGGASYHAVVGTTVDEQNAHIFEAQCLGLRWFATSIDYNVYIATSEAGLVDALMLKFPSLRGA